jgi:hypothetical protein
MPRPQSVPRCPFNISTTQVARGLVRIHQRLRGELVKAQSGSTVVVPAAIARPALGHIQVLMSLLGFELDASKLRPIKTQSQAGWPGFLPVPTMQTGRALIRLHQRLRGELAKQQYGEQLLVTIKTVRRAMIAIEALMPILGVDFDESLLRVVRNRVRVSPLGHGGMRAGILSALRMCQKAMTYQVRAVSDFDGPTITFGD